MTATTHIAGEPVTISGQYLRQRCGWCGEVLLEYDLTRVAAPTGQDPTPSTWAVGAQVTVDGRAQFLVDEGDPRMLADDSCARNPLTLASFGEAVPRG